MFVHQLVVLVELVERPPLRLLEGVEQLLDLGGDAVAGDRAHFWQKKNKFKLENGSFYGKIGGSGFGDSRLSWSEEPPETFDILAAAAAAAEVEWPPPASRPPACRILRFDKN